MPPTVYPCLCGHECETYAQMRHHRRKCEAWKTRPNPKQLARQRRAAHRRRKPPPKRCPVCNGRHDHHQEGCPNSLEERSRRELIERHDIDPDWWECFLEVLAKRYKTQTGWRKF